MKYLSIDYGKRRTGLAICDPLEILASPYAVLDGPEKVMAKLLDIIRQEQIEALVVGLPINMDGTEGFQAQIVRQFADQVARRTDIPIHFQDERLSSYEAKNKLRQARGSQAIRKGQFIDAMAAAEILTAFLEGKRPRTADDDMELYGEDNPL